MATGANLVVPLTSGREEFLDGLGDFTLNLQAGVEDLSDFGVLGDWNAGVTWQPIDGLDLSATYIWREVAPGLGALGNPQIVNLNVPVFDFVRGETVLGLGNAAAARIHAGRVELTVGPGFYYDAAGQRELPLGEVPELTTRALYDA